MDGFGSIQLRTRTVWLGENLVFTFSMEKVSKMNEVDVFWELWMGVELVILDFLGGIKMTILAFQTLKDLRANSPNSIKQKECSKHQTTDILETKVLHATQQEEMETNI